MPKQFSSVTAFVALLSAVLSVAAAAQVDDQLSRRAFLGVQVGALTEAQQQITDYGLNIVNVFADSTASAYNLQEGEIILQANGRRLENPGDLPEELAGLRSGAEVEFLLLRDGEEQQLIASLEAFPSERYGSASVHYGSVTTELGQQRTILTRPENQNSPPVVYILQGFDCSSIDMALNPGNSMAMLVERLNAAGFATYRVEKSGRGDSIGAACSEVGFDAETAGFVAGLDALVENSLVDADRVYLLGISLGGIWAPVLAEQTQLAGIISFGTIAKTWPEYMYDNWRRQWALAGKSLASVDRDLKLANQFWYQLIHQALPPQQIFVEFEQLSPLAPSVGYVEDGQLLFGRHYSFVQELARTNVMAYWESVNVPTLVLWGRGDYVASEADQQLIVDVLAANEVEVELQYLDVDHYWREAGDFETAYQGLRSGERPPISDEVYSVIIEWLTTTG